ncbi:MAG: hypothetical protein H6719_05355 [Sandaracinaceae bacterium]|nr:hypothetical protein [Sandaracinaceae bacterium]
MPDDAAEDEANPFERWGLDPMQGPTAITERMRDLAADAPDEATRKAIRAAWEELTMHPARRFRAAAGAHPDSHHVASAPPAPPPRPRPAKVELELADLLMRPSIVAALGLEDVAASPLPEVPIADDPIFDGDGSPHQW